MTLINLLRETLQIFVWHNMPPQHLNVMANDGFRFRTTTTGWIIAKIMDELREFRVAKRHISSVVWIGTQRGEEHKEVPPIRKPFLDDLAITGELSFPGLCIDFVF